MLTFPNIFAWGIKPNNQSLHTGEKQAYISNRFCSRASETKSVTIAPGLPYLYTKNHGIYGILCDGEVVNIKRRRLKQAIAKQSGYN